LFIHLYSAEYGYLFNGTFHFLVLTQATKIYSLKEENMFRKSKLLIFMAMFISMAVAFSACAIPSAPATQATPAPEAPDTSKTTNGTTTNDKPYAGTTLTLTTGIAESMEAIKQDFYDATGITLEISAMSSQDMNTKYSLEAASRTGSIDVMAHNHTSANDGNTGCCRFNLEPHLFTR